MTVYFRRVGKRPIFFQWVAVLPILAALTSCASHAQDNQTPVPTAAQSDNLSPKYEWDALHWHDRTLYQVGNHTLPRALVLPSWVSPLGDKGMYGDYSQVHRKNSSGQVLCSLILWLPIDQSQRTQQWLNRFPNQFFLPPKSYTVRSGNAPIILDKATGGHQLGKATGVGQWPKVRLASGPPDVKGAWIYRVSLHDTAPKQRINFVAMPIIMASGPNDPSLAGGLDPNFGLALFAPQSPLPPKKWVIMLLYNFAVSSSPSQK
jgi:hypothetical protein